MLPNPACAVTAAYCHVGAADSFAHIPIPDAFHSVSGADKLRPVVDKGISACHADRVDSCLLRVVHASAGSVTISGAVISDLAAW